MTILSRKVTNIDNEIFAVGDIIWYVNDEITNPDLHPHVVVAIDENLLYTVCGTSQQATIERKARNLKLPDYSLFPVISPTDENTLKKETFFDCYYPFEIRPSTLMYKISGGGVVRVGGKINYSEYEQIRSALKKNKTVDFKDLLIHTKDN